MENNTDTVGWLQIVEALSWARGAYRVLVQVAELAVEVDGGELRERETEQCAARNEPKEGIVALGKADRVVQVAGRLYEGVPRGSIWLDHGWQLGTAIA